MKKLSSEIVLFYFFQRQFHQLCFKYASKEIIVKVGCSKYQELFKTWGWKIRGWKVHGWKVRGWKFWGWKVWGWNVLSLLAWRTFQGFRFWLMYKPISYLTKIQIVLPDSPVNWSRLDQRNFRATTHTPLAARVKNPTSLTVNPSPFYLPCKKLIFVRLQIFLHAGCNFLHPEELSPHTKNYECSY